MKPQLAAATALGAFVLAQLVPYGHDHQNPPVGQEPAWDRPETRALAARACFDCHANTTVWPWYSQVAPVSWLVEHDVEEGRSRLNFTDFGSGFEDAEEAGDEVESGGMPDPKYLWMHPEARLSDAERKQLVDGLRRTLGEEH